MEPDPPEQATPHRNPIAFLIHAIGMNVLTIVAAVLIVSALLLALKGRAIYQGIEHYRATKVADEAMHFMKAERWESASRVLQDAMRRMPDQIPLLRAVTELFAVGYNDPQTAASFLRRVISKGVATPLDQRRLAEILLQSGDHNEARRLYGELPVGEQTSRQGLELLSAITRSSGHAAEADRLLRRALMLDANDKEARLRLAIMDEAQAFDEARAPIVQTIWDIASKGDDIAVKAIEHLATSKSLTAHQAKALISLVEKNPLATERIRYLALQAHLRFNPLDRSNVVAQEIARNQGKSADSIFDFLRWLGQQGQHDKILEIVPSESVSHDADTFLIYVDALAASEKWKELLNLMTTRRRPVTEATSHIILAQCYARLQPDLKESRRHLLATYSVGRKEVPVLLRAASLADNLHLNDLAIQGYKLIADARPTMRIQLWEKVLDLYHSDHNTSAMVETLHKLHDLRPTNRSYTDHLNYLRLIAGNELELASNQLLSSQELSDSNIPAALLRALVALRFGDAQRIKTEVAAINTSDQLPPGIRATVAGLLTLTGHDVEGFRLGEKILAAGLLDEEAVFLRLSLAN